MTLQEFFAQVGGSYDTAISRLRKDELIKKYLKMFLADESYTKLAAAVEAKDWKGVFAESHALKGLAANLELQNLFAAASAVCENTRHGDPTEDVAAQMQEVTAQYHAAVSAINEVE